MSFFVFKRRTALALMLLIPSVVIGQFEELQPPAPFPIEDFMIGGSFRIVPLRNSSEGFCVRVGKHPLFGGGPLIYIGGKADGRPWMLYYNVSRDNFVETFEGIRPGTVNGLNGNYGVGYIEDSTGIQRATRFWSGGGHFFIRFPEHYGEIGTSHCTDLNARGSYTGWFYRPSRQKTYAFFSDIEGNIQELLVPEGAGDSVANGIDESRSGSSTAAGWYQRPGTSGLYDRNACYWPRFESVDLPGVRDLLDSVAIDIDGHIVVGHSSRPGSTYRATYWNISRNLMHVIPGGSNGVARSCVDDNYIVGHTNLGPFLHHVRRDQTWSLDYLCSEYQIDVDGWTMETANSITSYFQARDPRKLILQIVGAARRGTQRKAYLLTLEWDISVLLIRPPGGGIERLPPPREIIP